MNYKYIIFTFFLFLFSCEHHSAKIEFKDDVKIYSNKGFTLVYNDDLLKNKLIDKKIDERSLIIYNKKLKKDTPVKITNLINGRDLIAKVGKKSKYPFFYNSVISDRIAKDLEIDLSEPYIQIQTININNTFVANKAKTFDEEKKVANKVPVDSISIKNISINQKSLKKKKIKINNFKYIIKFADLYFKESAYMLKDRLSKEFSIKEVKINKISDNNYRVYMGPFNNLESIKKAFENINNLDFENIEIIKL